MTPTAGPGRPPALGAQGTLFEDDAARGDDVGFRGPTACKAAGITYRQLDYWARTKLVEPSVRSAQGSGSQRLYSFRDILVLKVVKRLLDTGISLHNIRVAVEFLAQRGTTDLARTTLISDGATVYEATSDDEVIDLLRDQSPDLYDRLSEEAVDALEAEKAKRSRRAKKAASSSGSVNDGTASQSVDPEHEEAASWNG